MSRCSNIYRSFLFPEQKLVELVAGRGPVDFVRISVFALDQAAFNRYVTTKIPSLLDLLFYWVQLIVQRNDKNKNERILRVARM